ncbi:carbon-nitrogen hydrolase [Metschnikowia bicuspidata]|uniref:Carbon-nitrogen hydrolase n=1 Tax=Metschnikowia bicuspidata TaxID=27322 RepID=A0A4P9ZE08_9ASCO|nr:carbon-nitrogen hydrolase [Metschnikowia bicuspidata]
MPVPKAPLARSLNIALLQLIAGADKAANLAKVSQHFDRAVAQSSVGKLDVVILPECFNSPYVVDKFREYAEEIPSGHTSTLLAELARKHGVFIIGGSIPEYDRATGRIFNTSVSFDPAGHVIARHRKTHLFDIDIPKGFTFQESATLSAGDRATLFQLGDFGAVGLGICYDIRFPELAMAASRAPHNAFAMFYPGAFNTTTGPMHWHLLARARAVDNQIFTVLCSPGRDVGGSGYQAYGHSLVVDPSGCVVAEAGEGEEILYAQLDSELLPAVRTGIPVHYQRRFDVYDNVTASTKVGDI